MDSITIIQFGAAILGMGGLCLCVVSATNRRLRGLRWLTAAFATGFLCAIFMLMPRQLPNWPIIPADCLALIAFALLHVAVMEMMGSHKRLSRVSLILLALTAAADVAQILNAHFMVLRFIAVSLIIATQCLATGVFLLKTARRHEKPPAYFCAFILLFFATFNIIRAGLIATRHLHQGRWDILIYNFTYALYIAVALGLAFGYFWMSTTQLSSQLEYMAGTDPLTRLYNRRMFLDACEREVSNLNSKRTTFSILMVDLDHFKKINDGFGHSVGDAALVAAVEAMQNATRGSDVLARWGGEEFAALLPNADHIAAYIVAERIRTNVENVEMTASPIEQQEQSRVRLTASIGLATYQNGDDIQSLLRRADRGLYQAKNAGRNRVLIAPSLGELPLSAM